MKRFLALVLVFLALISILPSQIEPDRTAVRPVEWLNKYLGVGNFNTARTILTITFSATGTTYSAV